MQPNSATGYSRIEDWFFESEVFLKNIGSMDGKTIDIRNEFNAFRILINEMIKYHDIFSGITRR